MSSIGANYPAPVTVNGYSCKNCTDVDFAKKHIDPAHPKSGPYGVNAKDDPTVHQPTVTFGGSLTGPASENPRLYTQPESGNPTKPNPGQQVDLSA